MFVLPLFVLLRWIAELTPFLPRFSPPPEISLFWETSTAITPSGTQRVLPTPVGRKYLMGSSSLTSYPSMTLTYLLFSIAPLAVAPLLKSPLLYFLLPCSTLGRCFRTSPTNPTNYPFFSGLSPQRTSLFLQFSESSLG